MSFPSPPGWDQLVQFITAGLQSLYELTGSAGLAIILFTLVVKTLFIPLTLPALRNARRQQELAPMVRQIMQKHGKDRAAASAEQMALYRQYGFNPLAGCLPSLVQIPFFFALWQGINRLTGTQMGSDGFLWIPQVALRDPLFILPFLAALAQFFQTRMAMQNRDKIVDPQQRQMNTMMQFMPLMVIVFGFQVPSGAVLYWTVSSIFSAVQQYFITGWGSLTDLFPFLPRKQLKSLLPPPRDPNAPVKPGRFQRFQERMIEAQKQQQELQNGKKAGGSGQPAVQRPTPPVETQARVDEVVAQGNKYSEDAWRLPGAPGSTGRTVFSTNVGGSAAPDVAQRQPKPRRRSSNARNNRKKRSA